MGGSTTDWVVGAALVGSSAVVISYFIQNQNPEQDNVATSTDSHANQSASHDAPQQDAGQNSSPQAASTQRKKAALRRRISFIESAQSFLSSLVLPTQGAIPQAPRRAESSPSSGPVEQLQSRMYQMKCVSDEMETKIRGLELALSASNTQNKALREKINELERTVMTNQNNEADIKVLRQSHLVLMAQKAVACERSELSYHDLVNTMISSAYQLLQADRVSVFVVDEVRQELWLAVSDDAAGVRVPIGKGIAGTVARTKKILNISDCQTSDLFDSAVDKMTGYHTSSLVCVPIIANGSRPVAVCQALNKMKDGQTVSFDDEDAETLRLLGTELGGALRRKGLEVAFDRIFDRAEYSDDDLGISSFLALYTKQQSNRRRLWESRASSRACSENDEYFDASNAAKGGMSFELSQANTVERRRSSLMAGPVFPPPSAVYEESFQDVVENTGILANELTWNFDVFSKSQDELVLYVVDVYKASGIADMWGITDETLRHFAESVKRKYHDHPFHNFYHGFSVMQIAYLIMRDSKVKEYLTPLDTLAVLTAALCHDIDHPGVSNDYLIKSSSPLALLYNDHSVLENHHSRTTFDVLRAPSNDILKELSRDDKVTVRRLIIGGILATDMVHHMHYCEQLRGFADSYLSKGDSEELPFDISKESDRQFLVDILIHASDLSGQALRPELASQWGERVLQEFKDLADRESSEGLAVAPFMQGLDEPLRRAKCQQTFVSYVIVPLWSTMADLFPELSELHENVKKNLEIHNKEVEKCMADLPPPPENPPLSPSRRSAPGSPTSRAMPSRSVKEKVDSLALKTEKKGAV